MWELAMRQTPWSELSKRCQESQALFFDELNNALQNNRRPVISKDVLTNHANYVEVMKSCWAGDPVDRPTFTKVVSDLAECCVLSTAL
jgi:hypothetical protein